MYCHPTQTKKWAKSLKPSPTQSQLKQAETMRLAKQQKKLFDSLQIPLFF